MQQQSNTNGVDGRKIMLEKLFLAISITFSLSLFFQVREPHQHKSEPGSVLETKITEQILATLKKN